MGSERTTCIAASESRNRVRYKRRRVATCVLRVAEIPSSRVAIELPPRNVQADNTSRVGS